MILTGGKPAQQLSAVLERATNDLLIVSPFVSAEGVKLVLRHLETCKGQRYPVRFLTDLSPLSVIAGATDPSALRLFGQSGFDVDLFHLPKLHAKVYIADRALAMVGSSNLTAGGLYRNYEYNVTIDDLEIASSIHRDLTEFSGLGARISGDQLGIYCQLASRAVEMREGSGGKLEPALHREFKAVLQDAQDTLIALRFSGGSISAVFSRTILYLLRTQGATATVQLHRLVQSIHPDLCDDSIDRVIAGQHFGKKWKHAIRSAQQLLKSRGLIALDDGAWHLTQAGSRMSDNLSHNGELYAL